MRKDAPVPTEVLTIDAVRRNYRHDSRRVLFGCLLALAGLGLVGLAERFTLEGGASLSMPSSVFLGIVMAAALYGGWKPGLFAIAASVAMMLSLSLASTHTLMPTLPSQLQVGTFAVLALLVTVLCETVHAARRRIELRNRQLATEGERSRQINAALQESEKRLRLATESAGMGTWDTNLASGQSIWSDTHFDLLGLPRTPGGVATYGMWLDSAHPDDRQRILEAAFRARRENTDFRVEYRIVRGDNGRVRWLAAYGRYFYDAEGVPVRSVGIGFDITERRLAEEQLQRIGWMLKSQETEALEPQPYGDLAQSNARRTLLDAVGVDMLQGVVREYLDLLQSSASVCERNGDYAMRSFGTGWCRFMDAASRRLADTPDNRAAAASGSWHCHESCWQASRQSMETGQPVDMACNGGIRIYAVPIRAGNIPVGSMSFGYGDPPTDPAKLAELAELYGVSAQELAARAPDYASRPPFIVEHAKERLRGSARLIGEIVQRRRLEQELQKRLLELAETDRRKDEFLATLAHELRNPLAPMRNALQIMKAAGGAVGLANEARGILDRQMAQMVRLIDDLLDVSRISRNKLELRRERVELAAILHQAIEGSRPQIESARHRLELDLPERPLVLDADPVRLGQVFLNLLNNAAKYMEVSGCIRVAAHAYGGEVVVSVKDAGLGIAPETLPHVFDAFYQAGEALRRSHGGLGIGLSLARRLVELHGGSIAARSEGLGKGTEFIVRLPLAALDTLPPRLRTPQADAVDSPQPLRHRVLVVDDNRDSAESLAAFLELSGHDAQVALDGASAIELARRMQPDVIVCDIGLPKMSGHEVARRIRNEAWGGDIVLIALTGWGQEDDRQRSLDAGFDHHLVKPVDPVALARLIGSTPGGAEPRRPTVGAVGSANLRFP